MKWDPAIREYWDVGEEPPFFHLTQKKLAGTMKALICCDGKVSGIHTMEKLHGLPLFTVEPRYAATVLRITLPVGAEEDFERISGLKLTKPEQVHVN